VSKLQRAVGDVLPPLKKQEMNCWFWLKKYQQQFLF